MNAYMLDQQNQKLTTAMDCTIKDAESYRNKTDKVEITHTSRQITFLYKYNTPHHTSEL